MAEKKLNTEKRIIGGQYWRAGNAFFAKNDREGGPIQLCNFTADIIQETRYHEGKRIKVILTIRGQQHYTDPVTGEVKQRDFGIATVPADDLRSMSWVATQWGRSPVIFNESGAERDIATAMQLDSTNAVIRDVYTETGWTTIGGKPAFLTTSGAMTKDGLNPNIEIELPGDLSRFALPAIVPGKNRDAVASSFRLVNMAPSHITWPLLLATYASVLGETDFALHLAGKTGTKKSEMASLMQSHFGAQMDARHLPLSWTSTANALTALCWRAQHCLTVVDDFVPTGSAGSQRMLEQKADDLIRAAGNRSGRSRLTDTSGHQQTMFPRGLILSTGEDIPAGHSVRGRMFIRELSPSDVTLPELTKAQSERHLLPAAMADWIAWIAGNDARDRFPEMVRSLRDQYLGIGHSRTPSIMATLHATAMLLHEWLAERKYFKVDLLKMFSKAVIAVEIAGNDQTTFVENADPLHQFVATLRQLFATKAAHVLTRDGGIPENPAIWGIEVEDRTGEMPHYKPKGFLLGWIDANRNEFLWDIATYQTLKTKSAGGLAQTPATFLKRLKDGNGDGSFLTRVDTRGNRNTVRVTCQGSTRTVAAISLAKIIEKEDQGDATRTNDD